MVYSCHVCVFCICQKSSWPPQWAGLYLTSHDPSSDLRPRTKCLLTVSESIHRCIGDGNCFFLFSAQPIACYLDGLSGLGLDSNLISNPHGAPDCTSPTTFSDGRAGFMSMVNAETRHAKPELLLTWQISMNVRSPKERGASCVVGLNVCDFWSWNNSD